MASWLIISALDSGESGPGSGPPWPGTLCCVVLCYWARHFTLMVPLSTQVYEWIPANLMRWTSNPSIQGKSRNTPSRFMQLKPG